MRRGERERGEDKKRMTQEEREREGGGDRKRMKQGERERWEYRNETGRKREMGI
jgi:hypothetical protein